GARITSKQIEIYMQMRNNRFIQVLAAAKANISERSGRNIEHNKNKRQTGRERTWATRQDPFAEVWELEIVPLLQQGVYQATVMLDELQKKYVGRFDNSVLRSLQRKVKKWRALYGKEKPVMFLQEYEPGEFGVSDFTHPKEIVVTISNMPFDHIVYN